MKRSELLELLTANILSLEHERPLLVAVDGYDAAGKSMLAKELSEKLRGLGLNIIEASTDGFHNSRSTRYKRGKESPDGYYYDSFNYHMLKELLLDPLKTGDLRYKTRQFDYITDKILATEYSEAASDSILVFDGVFALRPELLDYWDYSIYLYVDEQTSLKRGIERNPGEEETTEHRYNVRYLPGQLIYHKEADPKRHASIVVDNNDPENPTILRKPYSQ